MFQYEPAPPPPFLLGFLWPSYNVGTIDTSKVIIILLTSNILSSCRVLIDSLNPALWWFSFHFPSVLSDAFVSSGQQVPYSTGLAMSTGEHPSVTRYVWSDHTLPVMDVYCGTGGLRARVATVSLDQTCKVHASCGKSAVD